MLGHFSVTLPMVRVVVEVLKVSLPGMDNEKVLVTEEKGSRIGELLQNIMIIL